ncbi:pimeloyl-ACP methyl ester carboxylesterase [Pedobacter sp. UYP30]|uniref:alpha/beta fold hydrolase n=1 Tax=Pedobacter sp. UYP30 TaxID=1756400 RepID=UPI0033998D30
MLTNNHVNAPTQFIEVGEIRFAYRRLGKKTGTPILLLGHFRANMENWDPAVTDGLGRDRPVILFSNTGIGASSGSTPDNVLQMAKDAITFIDAMGLQLIDLLGFSLGGFIAQQVTILRPDLIRRLVLAGTGPEGGEDMEKFTDEVTKAAINEPPLLEDFLLLFFSPSEKGQKAGKEFWNRRHLREAGIEPATTIEVMGAQAKAIADWGIPANQFLQLKRITQPVLIMNGNNDIMVPTKNSYLMFKHIENSKLILYPDSGHGFLFQYPLEFVEDVSAFLNKSF